VLVGGGSHFLPGFAQDTDHFIVGRLVRELGELMFEENEAQGVFEHAAVGVVGEVFLEVQVLDANDGIVRITDLAEDFAGFLGVKCLECVAPLQIPGAGHGIGTAGDFPAAQVLATRGKAEFLGSLGRKFEDPIGEPAGVNEFAGPGSAVNPLDIWVGCIMLVEQGERRLKPIRIAGVTTHGPQYIIRRARRNRIQFQI